MKKYIYILQERKINNDGTLDRWHIEWSTDSKDKGNQWVSECDDWHFRQCEKVKNIDFK